MAASTVFISSVRRGLEAERDYVPGLIQALGLVPSRFEDFTAADAPSRATCLQGVEGADVYVLLLGEHYGTRMSDTGTAPTEEELAVARRRGIPVLVFHKRGVEPDADQADFIAEVGSYAGGWFWADFVDSAQLGVALAGALRQLTAAPDPLSWTSLGTPAAVPWRTPLGEGALARRHVETGAVLEAHLAVTPGTPPPLRTSQLSVLQERLAATGRRVGLFSQAAGLDVGHNVDRAWATTAAPDGRPHAVVGGRADALAGLSVSRRGDVSVWQALPVDSFGALVDERSVRERLAMMLGVATDASPLSQGQVVPAAGFNAGAQLTVGDPAALGRSSATFPMGWGGAQPPLRTGGEHAVAMSALPAGVGEVAADLAAELLTVIRQGR